MVENLKTEQEEVQADGTFPVSFHLFFPFYDVRNELFLEKQL